MERSVLVRETGSDSFITFCFTAMHRKVSGDENSVLLSRMQEHQMETSHMVFLSEGIIREGLTLFAKALLRLRLARKGLVQVRLEGSRRIPQGRMAFRALFLRITCLV